MPVWLALVTMKLLPVDGPWTPL